MTGEAGGRKPLPSDNIDDWLVRVVPNTVAQAPVVFDVIPARPVNIIELGRTKALEFGWGVDNFKCLDELIGEHESGWNPNAQNKWSTAYGIGQFLDSTWAGTGIKKTSDPALQIEATYRYIENRYGNPCVAEFFWHNVAPTINGLNWY